MVDDEVDHASALAEAMTDFGWQVTTTRDGNSALSTLASGNFDVALLDIGMLGMDGCQLAVRIRDSDNLHSLLLVAVSGHTSPLVMARAMSAGIDAYMVKPVRLDRLRADLEEMLADPRRRRRTV